jgi:ribose transport system substrate-binding protein
MVMRRFVYLPILLVVIAVLFSACAKRQTTSETTASPQGQLRIAVVPKGTAHSFWLTVKAGAEQAGQEEGVQILWKGPAEETDVEGQQRILEDFINQKVDAIVMAACDADGMVPIVKQAMAAGIPVITIDSGVNSDDPLSFVATDNVAAAAKAAEVLCELVGGKGKVGMIPFIKGAASSEQREQGFREGIKKCPGVTLGPVLYSQSQVERAMQVTEDMLTANPDLVGIFAANEPGAVGAATVLEQRGLAGKVKLVAFDAAQPEIDALRRGTIQALIVQNPFKMGYEGVKLAVKAIKGDRASIPKRVDTGVTVVTKENIDNPEVQELLKERK